MIEPAVPSNTALTNGPSIDLHDLSTPLPLKGSSTDALMRLKKLTSSLKKDVTSPESPVAAFPHTTKTFNDISRGTNEESDDKSTTDSSAATLTPEEQDILAKIEVANRKIEEDSKSITSQNIGSRRGSINSLHSVVSSNSISSHTPEDDGNANPSLPAEETWEIWGKLVNDWDTNNHKKSQLVKDLVRKGVPQPFRGLVWQMLCGAHENGVKSLYADYMKQSSPCEKLIRRDIARTYPEHEFFREKDGPGQESLFNVMKAYSLHDKEVGYCQGSAFIVGLLLMQMPEEDAFAVLVELMQSHRLREIFKPSMQELGLCMQQLENLVQEYLPDLLMHFTAQSLHTSMYASSWFLTLFATSLPLKVAFRVMDAVLLDGLTFVFQMSIAILKISAQSLSSMDMEAMMNYFHRELSTVAAQETEYLMSTAFGVKVFSKKMKKWEKDYLQLQSKGQEDQIELRRLRTENKLLRQRIDHLEKESAALADRLIQGQVTRAKEQEEIFVIKRELSALKQHDCETVDALKSANKEMKDMAESRNNGKKMASETSEMLKTLQIELMGIRLKEAEMEHTLKEMQCKIEEKDEENRLLQEGPHNSIAALQDELITVKLREAEANLSLKEMKGRVQDLEEMWERHQQKLREWETNGKLRSSKGEVLKLQEDLMSAKIRENDAVATTKELRQRLMEMETQNHVLTNQLSRVDDENHKLKDRLHDKKTTERLLRQNVLDHKHKISNLESKLREENMMARINAAEHGQKIAELQQKIASLESLHQEYVTAGQLGISRHGRVNKGPREGIPDLQEEVEQLRVNQKVEALHLNRKYLDAKYASKRAASEGAEETELPQNPFEAMTISSMMTASSLGIFEDDDDVVDVAPAPPRNEEEEAEVSQLSEELTAARAELASLLTGHESDDDIPLNRPNFH